MGSVGSGDGRNPVWQFLGSIHFPSLLWPIGLGAVRARTRSHDQDAVGNVARVEKPRQAGYEAVAVVRLEDEVASRAEEI